jgi:hypothetical protein
MKFHTLLSAAALCVAAFFSSCQNDSAASKDAAATETTGTAPGATAPTLDPGAAATAASPVADPSAIAPLPTGTAPAPNPAAQTEPPQNAAGVWHYTCPKGCAGGGGAATACAKCGTTLAHNSAYHGTPSTAATTVPAGDKTAPAKQPEPAQNKAGVWHYTCADGCAGGSGAASPCGKCGKTLVHNSAYHQ